MKAQSNDMPYLVAIANGEHIRDCLWFYMTALRFIYNKKLWKEFNKYAQEHSDEMEN